MGPKTLYLLYVARDIVLIVVLVASKACYAQGPTLDERMKEFEEVFHMEHSWPPARRAPAPDVPRAAAVVYWSGAIADIGTTWYGLNEGLTEGNTVATLWGEEPEAVLLWGAAIKAGIYLATRRIYCKRGRTKRCKGLLYGIGGLQWAAAVSNADTINDRED